MTKPICPRRDFAQKAKSRGGTLVTRPLQFLKYLELCIISFETSLTQNIYFRNFVRGESQYSFLTKHFALDSGPISLTEFYEVSPLASSAVVLRLKTNSVSASDHSNQ